jgi:lipid-A-disaccharide synthase
MADNIEKIPVQFLVSAGEASSDMYAAGVIDHLSRKIPDLDFYGCAGPKLQAAGVRPVIMASDLAVVGLAEVVTHLPRIYGKFLELANYAEQHPPVAALLTDSPDFHLRLATRLKRIGVPVFYLVAPQVWAWRQSRVRKIRRLVDSLFCLFPFEEKWFRERGVNATYVGHPLAFMARPALSREEFFSAQQLPEDQPLITLLPGSRAGEACRHVPALLDAVSRLRQRFQFSVILATPRGFATAGALQNFREPMSALAIKVVENHVWDSIGHADLALAASGTVTIEAAVLGTPMVTFYKVNPLSWWAGRRLVKVPFLSMVNLIAGRAIVPELMQERMTGKNIAGAAGELLGSKQRMDQMRADLAAVRAVLTVAADPLERVALEIEETLGRLIPHAEPGYVR